MNLRLNARRRSINVSVYLVFFLEAGRFKFLGENLLGVGQSKMSYPSLTPSYNVQQESTQNPLNSSNSPFRYEQTV